MTKRMLLSSIATLVLLLGTAGMAWAEGGPELMTSGVNVQDTASLQRGAKLFMNYCSGCHSLHFMRYSRIAKDLDLSQKQVMDHLNFTGGNFHDPIVAAMPADGATQWF